MKWIETRYTVERIKKQCTFNRNGNSISLTEHFNSKGENIMNKALLLNKGKEITKRLYSQSNRDKVIRELSNLADGKIVDSIDALSGIPNYK